MAKIAATFAGKNAKPKDFMVWPVEEKPEVTPQALVRALQVQSKKGKAKSAAPTQRHPRRG